MCFFMRLFDEWNYLLLLTRYKINNLVWENLKEIVIDLELQLDMISLYDGCSC